MSWLGSVRRLLGVYEGWGPRAIDVYVRDGRVVTVWFADQSLRFRQHDADAHQETRARLHGYLPQQVAGIVVAERERS